SAANRARRLLLAATQAGDLVLARQAERVQDAAVLLREEGLEVVPVKEGVARTDVHPTAGHRRPRPDRPEVDLPEPRAAGPAGGDQLAARHGREVDDAVGHGDPRGDRVAD